MGKLIIEDLSLINRIINSIGLLYLINLRSAAVRGTISTYDSGYILQKLTFLAQKEQINKKHHSFDYNFFIYKEGPYSDDLSDNFNGLVSYGLIQCYLSKNHPERSELTNYGKRSIENLVKILYNYIPDFFKDIELIINETKDILSKKEMVKIINNLHFEYYDSELQIRKENLINIKNKYKEMIPLKIVKHKKNELLNKLKLTKKEIMDIILFFQPSFVRATYKGINDLLEGKIYSDSEILNSFNKIGI